MPADSRSSSTGNPLRTVRISDRQLINANKRDLDHVMRLWMEAWTEAGATRFTTWTDFWANQLVIRAVGGDDRHPILLTLSPGASYDPSERSGGEP